MRSLLFSLDHVYREDGTLTPLELNTNTGTDFPENAITVDNFISATEGFYDHVTLHTFLSSSNITKVETIAAPNLNNFFQVFSEYYGYEFTNHDVNPDDVTVPYVEDADDKLIVRIAYNTYAIVDDLYARDNYQFHNLIKSESFSSPVTFTTSSFDTITAFENAQSSSYPNYLIKARYPEYTPGEYPKLYNFITSSQLDNLKSSLTDDEFIQKYEFNSSLGVENERVRFLRSLNLAIGDDLSQVINLCNYSKAHSLSLTNERLVWDSLLDSNNRFNNVAASQFYPTFYTRYAYIYHNDADDYILDHTGSLIDFENVVIGKEIKSIQFSGQLDSYMSGSLSDLSSFTINSSSVLAVQTKTEGGIFANVTASNSDNSLTYKWFDGHSNPYLTYRSGSLVRGGEVGYIGAGELFIGDEIYTFNSSSNTLETFTITDINFSFKDKEAGYITVGPFSQFFVQLKDQNDLFLIQHNFCFSGCDVGTCAGFTCNDCGKNSTGCINCGGPAGTTCSQ